MITITVVDNTNLRQLEAQLINLSPLMEEWKQARINIFESQFRNELSPSNTVLRSLSIQYLEWKRRNYPGKKKRELTGETYKSHKFVVRPNELIEQLEGNAIYLQGYLELPLLPEDWSNPTERELVNITDRYLNKIL